MERIRKIFKSEHLRFWHKAYILQITVADPPFQVSIMFYSKGLIKF